MPSPLDKAYQVELGQRCLLYFDIRQAQQFEPNLHVQLTYHSNSCIFPNRESAPFLVSVFLFSQEPKDVQYPNPIESWVPTSFENSSFFPTFCFAIHWIFFLEAPKSLTTVAHKPIPGC